MKKYQEATPEVRLSDDIGTKITDIMGEQGISAEDIGVILGMSEAKIENRLWGGCKLTTQELSQIALVLGKQVKIELVDYKPSEPTPAFCRYKWGKDNEVIESKW